MHWEYAVVILPSGILPIFMLSNARLCEFFAYNRTLLTVFTAITDYSILLYITLGAFGVNSAAKSA